MLFDLSSLLPESTRSIDLKLFCTSCFRVSRNLFLVLLGAKLKLPNPILLACKKSPFVFLEYIVSAYGKSSIDILFLKVLLNFSYGSFSIPISLLLPEAVSSTVLLLLKAGVANVFLC